MVHKVSGQHGLVLRNVGADFLQAAGAVFVFEKDVCAIGSLDAVKFVVNGFVGADHKVHLGVRHLEPCTLCGVVIVREHRLGHFQKVFTHAFLDGDVGRGPQKMRNALNLVLVCIVVPYALEGTVLGPSYKRVRAFLCGILKGRKLLLGHVHGVEVGAKRLGAVALYKGLVVHAIPGAVVHVCELLCRRVLKVVKR